jgi:tetratricopeptide (TPR) repeat protein
MWRNRAVILLFGILSIIILYSFPKVVVDNEENKGEGMSSPDSVSAQFHGTQASKEDLDKISNLKSKLGKPDNKEKSSIFADSLAEAFRIINEWDSAAYYLGNQAKSEPSIENLKKAGQAYFQAQGFAVEQSEIENLGRQAREFFDEVLAINPKDLETKVNKGLTFIASSNPMQGILMLREVIEQDPENEMALYNLGILSMQSAQWQRAVERFETLIKINPENPKVHFYLGMSYLELKQSDLAKEHFLKVKELDKDPEVQANVDSYLKEINDN